MKCLKVRYENTDTFGGESNYSWVNRGEILMDDKSTDRKIVMKVKKELGFTGIRCNTIKYGDMIEIRPIGICQVIFITFGE